MGVYDDAARFAAEADPPAFLARILVETRRQDLTFRTWLNPRTSPLPGSPERTADLLAVLDDPQVPEVPWLLGIELQSRPDEQKLRVTLESTGIFTARFHPGSYRVTSAIVHLTGQPTTSMIDARLGKFGTFHRPIPWDVSADAARTALDRVARDQLSWAILFWVPLMRGGERVGIATRWRSLVGEKVADRTRRSDLAGIALVFAELAGRYLLWERILGGWEMTESAVVNRWINQGETRGDLRRLRRVIIELLDIRFPGAATQDVRQVIEQQEDLPLLEQWFQAAARVKTYADFLRDLRG